MRERDWGDGALYCIGFRAAKFSESAEIPKSRLQIDGSQIDPVCQFVSQPIHVEAKGDDALSGWPADSHRLEASVSCPDKTLQPTISPSASRRLD